MQVRRSRRRQSLYTIHKLKVQKQKEKQMDKKIAKIMADDVIDNIKSPRQRIEVLRETSIIAGDTSNAINALIEAYNEKQFGDSYEVSEHGSRSFSVPSGSYESLPPRIVSWSESVESRFSTNGSDTRNCEHWYVSRGSSIPPNQSDTNSSSVIFIKEIQRTPVIKIEPNDN